jgi:hypothetical protein
VGDEKAPDWQDLNLRPPAQEAVSIIAQLFAMFAMFVCSIGVFPAPASIFLLPYLPYIHYKHIYIYIYNILKSLDNPVYNCVVNDLHTFVFADT